MSFLKNLKLFFSLFKPVKKIDISEFKTFRTKEIEYVFLFVKGETAEELDTNISSIVEKATEYEAVIDSTSSNYVSIFFNTPMEIENPKEKSLRFIDELMIHSKEQNAIIHGSCVTKVGNFGTRYRIYYSAHIPNQKEIMKELSNLEYGQVMRLDA